jgi:uncharacterized protein (DUF362 family)
MSQPPPHRPVSRRRFLEAGAGMALGGLGLAGWSLLTPGCGDPEAAAARDNRAAGEGEAVAPQADVVVARAADYRADLLSIVRDGLTELGLRPAWAADRTVLLKPNMVEPHPDAPHINTHPALVRAVAELFREWGARRVLVAEGPGHCRDGYLVLDQSGYAPMLREAGLPFVDLNHGDVFPVANRSGLTGMPVLYLSRIFAEVDIVVSLPKLKTHHWAVATLSMKNLFGLLPGIVYGWPKNVLHWRGLHESILDINASVRPTLAIVDGIVGMEGDGPIMGAPREAGVLVMGRNLTAVDATAARLMGIDPEGVPYLDRAAGVLGPIDEPLIRQRGEPLASLAQPFELLDLPHLQGARLSG